MVARTTSPPRSHSRCLLQPRSRHFPIAPISSTTVPCVTSIYLSPARPDSSALLQQKQPSKPKINVAPANLSKSQSNRQIRLSLPILAAVWFSYGLVLALQGELTTSSPGHPCAAALHRLVKPSVGSQEGLASCVLFPSTFPSPRPTKGTFRRHLPFIWRLHRL